MDPDFSGIVTFCKAYGFETVVAFSRQASRPDRDLHVRDFCPAVGVPESAGAGTTNAALACYLLKHELVESNGKGVVGIFAEQGMEVGRTSTVHSVIYLDREADSRIARLQVGVGATRILAGELTI